MKLHLGPMFGLLTAGSPDQSGAALFSLSGSPPLWVCCLLYWERWELHLTDGACSLPCHSVSGSSAFCFTATMGRAAPPNALPYPYCRYSSSVLCFWW